MNYIIFIAALPVVALLVYIYKQDKVEKEPIGLLLKLLLFGGISVVSAIILEMIGEEILGLFFTDHTMFYEFLDCFIVVGISEELGKFYALKWGSWKNRAFNYRFDGVVYGVCSSMGFALVENIEYVTDGGFSTALSRALTAVPAHAIFGVFMGLFYGQAKYCEAFGDQKGKKKNLRRALWIPAIVHGFYDFCLSVDSGMAVLTFYVFLIALYVVAFTAIKKASREDVPLFSTMYFWPESTNNFPPRQS